MTTYLGKSCSFGLPRVPFVNCGQFMYLVISLLVLRAGCGIWLYQFLIIAYLFTFHLKVKWIWPISRKGSLRLITKIWKKCRPTSRIPYRMSSTRECQQRWLQLGIHSHGWTALSSVPSNWNKGLIRNQGGQTRKGIETDTGDSSNRSSERSEEPIDSTCKI